MNARRPRWADLADGSSRLLPPTLLTFDGRILHPKSGRPFIKNWLTSERPMLGRKPLVRYLGSDNAKQPCSIESLSRSRSAHPNSAVFCVPKVE